MIMVVNDGVDHQRRTASDPERSITFLHSRRIAKPKTIAMEIYETVDGDLQRPVRDSPPMQSPAIIFHATEL